MIVVIDGIDRVGKTTIANKISNVLNIPIYHDDETHFSIEKMDNENETDKMLKMLQVLYLTNSSMIFDRFHMTDFVYGCIERNYDKTDALKNWQKIDEKLKQLDAVLILVTPTSVNLSSIEHGHNLSNHHKLFQYLFDMSLLDKYMCDYNSMDSIIQSILNSINK